MKKSLLVPPSKTALPPSIYKKRLLRTNPKNLHHKTQRAFRSEVIEAKKEALVNALRVPPALQQFKTFLGDDDFAEIKSLFSNYKPESRKERRERLKRESEQGRRGERPTIVKSGIRHVTDLIEESKAKLVLIACDVDPIEIVLFLPTLCKKMGIAYAFVKSKYDLGAIIGRKSATTLCLCTVGSDKRTKFDSLIRKCNGLFQEKYEIMLSTWGEPVKEEN